jgi:hypothetical protein
VVSAGGSQLLDIDNVGAVGGSQLQDIDNMWWRKVVLSYMT